MHAPAAIQLAGPEDPGEHDELKVVKADPEGARKLLVDPGYKDGFNLVLRGPNNRYINDGLILEATAQMRARIGINTRVAASPMADFAPRVSIGRKDASAWLLGWGFVTGEVSYGLRALVACENKERGFGTNNGASYCNPKMDELMIRVCPRSTTRSGWRSSRTRSAG